VRQILQRLAAVVGALLLAALAIAGFSWTHYFDAAGLDPRPYPLRAVEIRPPVQPDGIEYFGKMRMDVYIDAEGKVDRIEVRDNTLPQKVRDDAVKAFSTAPWEPGRKWGVRVKSVKRIEIDLDPPRGAGSMR